MDLFLCTQCGGQMESTRTPPVYQCPFCGFLKIIDEQEDKYLKDIKTQAEKEFLECRFDSAAKLYNSAVAHSKDSLSYWMLMLCAYGVQYWEMDNGTKIPVCHRVQNLPVLQNQDYLEAVKYAKNSEVAAYYRQQAEEIEKIQEKLREVSRSRYDVILCAADADDEGSRTQEGSHSRELAYRLSSEGYSVLYLPMMLSEQEQLHATAYLQAATNTAKVFFVIGYSKENFWKIQRQWNVLLERKQEDNSLFLMPYYNSAIMDVKDIPQPLQSFQAKHAPQAGISDLIEYVRTILPLSAGPVLGKKEAALLTRAYLFLEDEEWERAEAYCEKILAKETRAAEVYICKFLAKNHLHGEDELSATVDLSKQPEFIQALQYADPQYRDKLYKYSEAVLCERIRWKIDYDLNHDYHGFLAKDFDAVCQNIEKDLEEISYSDYATELRGRYEAKAKDVLYQCGMYWLKALRDTKELKDWTSRQHTDICLEQITEYFARIPDHADVKERMEETQERYGKLFYSLGIKHWDLALNGKWEDMEENCETAKESFRKAKFYGDSKERLAACDNIKQERAYVSACKNFDQAQKTGNSHTAVKAAIEFEALGDFKDSAQKALACRWTAKLNTLKEREKTCMAAVERLEKTLKQLKEEEANLPPWKKTAKKLAKKELVLTSDGRSVSDVTAQIQSCQKELKEIKLELEKLSNQ